MDESSTRNRRAPVLLMLASLVIVIAGIKAASSILIPLLLVIIIAIVCTSPLFWLQRKGVPTVVAVTIILIAIVISGFLLGTLIGASMNNFLSSLPEYRERLSTVVKDSISYLRKMGISIPAQDVTRNLLESGMSMAGGIMTALSNILVDILLTLFTVMFILLEAADFPRKLRAEFKKPERSLQAIDKFILSAKRYLVIKTVISAAVGLVIWLFLLILGVDYPVLWGTLSFLLNYIPNIGAIIAALPVTLFALIQLGVMPALLVILGFSVVHIVIGYIVEPKVMGKGLRLSTLVVFLSLFFWGWVLGPVGMILSVPITSLIKIAMENNEKTRGFAVMLGSGTKSRDSG